MNHDPHVEFAALREELFLLTEASLRGEATESESVRLESLLTRSDLLEQYVEYVQQSVSLGVWATSLMENATDPLTVTGQVTPDAGFSQSNPQAKLQGAPIDLTGPSTPLSPSESASGFFGNLFSAVPGFGTGTPALLLTALVSVVVGSIVTALVLSSMTTPMRWKSSLAHNESAHDPSQSVVPAAYLISANGCDWAGGTPRLQSVGSSVQVGDEVTLSEGIAEFRLANGVALSLEGPASIVLASPSTLVLQYGKLTAHVRWNVTDFKVIAGACRFTACDSEFGLLQDGSKVEVHVFSGAVHAESPQVIRDAGGPDFLEGGALVIDDAGAFTKGTITAGNAFSLLTEGDTLKVGGTVGQKAKPELFATKLSMAGALPVTKNYVDAVTASSPMGYWRFESTKGGVVTNEVDGGRDLKIVGNVRLTGQAENAALEFQPKSQAHLVSEPFNDLVGSDYSIELWIKPSHVHKGSLLSLMWATDGREGATSLELQGTHRGSTIKNPPASVRFVHHTPTKGTVIGTSCFSKKPYSIRRWQHIVAVKEGARMRLYIDGKLSKSARDTTSFSSDLRLYLGWVPFKPELGFVGQIDELSIYKRALSEKEIVAHYEAVEDVAHGTLPYLDQARQAFYRLIRPVASGGHKLANSSRNSDVSELLLQ